MRYEKKTPEQQRDDLFFLRSLIEYIARKTKNDRGYIVTALGENTLRKIYNLADVYHCENMDKLVSELVRQFNIKEGTYDNLCNLDGFRIPTHWEIGRVYERLTTSLEKDSGTEDCIPTLIQVYTSWLPQKIDNYRSSTYYENNSYLTASYHAGHNI